VVTDSRLRLFMSYMAVTPCWS